ncbi:hypothetical protein ACFXPQ_02465 [Streptomyces lydicus]|uniref:hypothetical protein n=1 Tax=Streptomyces lydicus TaxID=47763 RepID=UPI00369C317C
MTLGLIRFLLALSPDALHGFGAVVLPPYLARTAFELVRLVRLLRSPGPRLAEGVAGLDMAFIPPDVTAAGLKAPGSVAGGLIGRYRPTGVPRLGSTRGERRGAYVRLLDSSARSFGYAYQVAHLRREASRAADRLPLGQMSQTSGDQHRPRRRTE